MAAKTLNSVGADVQAIHFILIVLQQTLGQVVTDKAVNAQDQDAGATGLATGFATTQTRAFNQTQFTGQLRAAQVEAIFVALTGSHYQRVLTAGDTQRIAADHLARCVALVTGNHFSAPDNQLVLAHSAEGARVRLSNSAHQIEQVFCRTRPLQQAISRCATAEVGGFGFVLCSFLEFALRQQRQGFSQ